MCLQNFRQTLSRLEVGTMNVGVEIWPQELRGF